MAVAKKCPDELRELAVRLGRAPLDSDKHNRERERGCAESRRPGPSHGDAADVSDGLRTAAFPSDRGRTEAVRRRVLLAQLARLAERAVGTNPAALDAAARGVRLALRLERNQLAW